jgi:hypothetical protein
LGKDVAIAGAEFAWRVIQLTHCNVAWTDTGCITRFDDGTETEACPHDTAHYRIVASRLGYGDDILAYCREHELAHSLVGAWIFGGPSQVLWGVAHDMMLTGRQSALEECFAQACQRFWRANERPILSGLPKLDEWKAEALAMIEAENASWAMSSRSSSALSSS